MVLTAAQIEKALEKALPFDVRQQVGVTQPLLYFDPLGFAIKGDRDGRDNQSTSKTVNLCIMRGMFWGSTLSSNTCGIMHFSLHLDSQSAKVCCSSVPVGS